GFAGQVTGAGTRTRRHRGQPDREGRTGGPGGPRPGAGDRTRSQSGHRDRGGLCGTIAPVTIPDPVTTPELRLSLEAPARRAVDEPLIALARLAAAGPVTTSSRLNLIESDLSVVVTGPGAHPVRAIWPYPVDSGLRRVTLAAGEVLEGGVLLLAGSGRK